jgi:hypothetical protein
MPVKRFWLVYGNIPRLQAENDTRQLRLMMASQGPEAKQLSESLIKEIGTVSSELNPKRDKNATEKLKNLGGLVNK